jgi:hypothetical protein
MKTLLKIDCYVQITVFFGYIIFALINSLLQNGFAQVWFKFYFVVGGFQLASYFVKIVLGFWKDLFIKIYGIMILPIWLVLLLEKCYITIDALFIIPFYGLLTSPVMAFFYLLHCRDKSTNPSLKL